VYPGLAQKFDLVTGSYLCISKADVHTIMQVEVFDTAEEMRKAERGNYAEKVATHQSDHIDHVSLNNATKKLLKAENGEALDVYKYVPKDIAAASITVELSAVKEIRGKKELEFDDLDDTIHTLYNDQIFFKGQNWYMQYDNVFYNLEVKSFEFLHEVFKTAASADASHTLFDESTKINIEPVSPISIKGARNPISFDFNNLGIGGLDDEFKEIFRRTFATRLFPPKVIESLGINHVRGMLLYGPPGCGKTLMARKIGCMLNGPEPKIVNGPEILNKFVGQSEENIRNLFADAEADQKANGDKAELHVIIFDELDAICKQRSGSSAPGSHDSIVNQLLSKIDGVNSINNILLIGMTNRKELLDDALLRPGRLEVHIEIPLPNVEGRLQILNIHMGKAQSEGYLAPDVNITELAEMTKNYTGAEIGGVCKNAAQYALTERNMESGDGSTPMPKDLKNIRVEMNDYVRAIAQSTPAFGASNESLGRFEGGEKYNFGPRFGAMMTTGSAFVKQVKESAATDLLSILFKGPEGSGKTAIAATLAAASEFPFIKIISPEDLVGKHEAEKMARITKVFDEASKSPLSIVILDEVERLLEYVPEGPRFSNMLLQTLQVLIKKKPRPGHRLVIMGTTNQEHQLSRLGLLNGFNTEIDVPNLDRTEILCTLAQFGVDTATMAQLADAISEDIGIKKLLLILELAKTEGGGQVTVDSFKASACDCNYECNP